MTKLLAPNGKPSNLTAEQYKLVRTPAFIEWFGDWQNDPENASKVIDENGEPKVVYHGAEIFNKKEIGKFNLFRNGSYFTDTYKSAKYYAFKLAYGIDDVKEEDTEIYEIFLNIKNPKTFDYVNQDAEDLFHDFNEFDERISEYKNKGYDGLIWEYNYKMYDVTLKEKETHYITFNSNQIKLADGTNTTFDGNNPDIRFYGGGEVIINPTEIECHKCHWHWKVKDGGDDLFICHKCFTDNSKYYKFEGLEGQKILDTISYAKGGRTISQTPAPKKDQIKGSDKNKEGSAKNIASAKKIKFSDDVLEKIQNSVDKHNKKHPNKKITIESAKAVVRRGMGAYSQTYRPTISGGKPNSRVAWGLARLNAFLYKIVNGKSKSGKYSQDNDLIEELGYKVQKFSDGGELENDELNKIKEAYDFGSEYFDGNIYGQEYKIRMNKNHPRNSNRNDDQSIHNLSLVNTEYPSAVVLREKYDKLQYQYDKIYNWDLAKEKIQDFFYEIKDRSDDYSNGGDIEAYKEAIGISEFDEGGETKPKKVYVSIKLPYEIKKLTNAGDSLKIYNKYFYTYDEKPFQELKNLKLEGLVGVSTSPNNIAEWFVSRDCLIVMDYDEFIWLNETETIDYYDSYQLMKNNLYLFKRLYANVTRYGEQEGADILTQTLKKIFEKIIPEINLQMNLSEGQKYSELYRISRFLSPYETSAFTRWIETNEIKIENPVDVTNAILEFNKLYDSYLGIGFDNPVLTFDELLPIVEKGITNASRIYESEQEIVLTNLELNIPKNSQLFFIGKNELGEDTESNKFELIEQYDLKDLYKVYFVDRKDIEKYRSIWLKKEEEKFNKRLQKGQEELELKKDRVVQELLSIFLDKSLNSFKQEVEKEILEYSQSLFFYDTESDDYIEQKWDSIIIVQTLINKYIEIVQKNWKEYIESKSVRDLNLYSFSQMFNQVENELKEFNETNKNELDKINNYKNNEGYYLSDWRMMSYLKKSVYDYEDLPQWIDYKELSKMYLYKMGVDIYRYYDKKDLPLESKYESGGETDETILVEKTKNNIMNTENPKDTITMDIPLLIRYSELIREEIKSDVALHEIVENLLEIKDKGALTMDDYESIVGNVTGAEENTNTDVQEEIMSEGGKLNSIKSKKGDIKVSLDENWYSDDTKVELVPVSELVKFREFDRKVKPKYNQDNSRDNINHLKYMFQKDGVKEPLIIEYSPQDNAVLVIEGNHRINSAMDLGMEYLPARVVLRKYSPFTPIQLKNTMSVSGVTADNSGYISSDLKPSQVGIEGTMPIYADGGIIEGRLHSECDADEGCGRKFQVGENGHIIEAERDEAVIVADAFNDDAEYTIKGTPSEVASALNVMGGGKNFDKGAIIIKNGQELEIPELKKQAIDTDVDDIIDPSSIIINRRSMADGKEYEVTGTTKQIASAINSINGNGVVIERGAEIKEN
jgi:hypothetical protein